MAEENKNEANTKKSRWTDAETYSMMYQMVQQLAGSRNKTPVKFDKINVPGRTPRALQDRWNKIRTDFNAAGISTQGPADVSMVRAPRTPGGKKAKANANGDGEACTPTPSKHAKVTPKKRKRKEETSDDESESMMRDLKDISDDDPATKQESDAEEDEDHVWDQI